MNIEHEKETPSYDLVEWRTPPEFGRVHTDLRVSEDCFTTISKVATKLHQAFIS
jgi:hypothetical protein